jgi:nucleolar GTP-binding protein
MIDDFFASPAGLTKPITEMLNAYRILFKSLHPFEATVAELTLAARMKAGSRHIDDIVVDLKTLRMSTSTMAKEYASRGSNATSAQEAKELMEEGKTKLEELYQNSQVAGSLSELLDLQKDLRKIPVVELDTPTVVLVGSPNVGKSSIVRVVSSGTPEVNDYPFTTRGVTIGYIIDPERQIRLVY